MINSGFKKISFAEGLTFASFNLLHQRLNCNGTHLEFFLTNRRQLNAFHCSKFDIVEPN